MFILDSCVSPSVSHTTIHILFPYDKCSCVRWISSKLHVCVSIRKVFNWIVNGLISLIIYRVMAPDKCLNWFPCRYFSVLHQIKQILIFADFGQNGIQMWPRLQSLCNLRYILIPF